MRGEDSCASNSTTRREETPPRAWGRQQAYLVPRKGKRNTPTCVGKTKHALAWWLKWRKHPHVRGEDADELAQSAEFSETPPRAWGRPCRRLYSAPQCGNTPTCVGKTGGRVYLRRAFQKHPHVRGEDLHLLEARCSRPETPPRAWGRQWLGAHGRHRQRNTPTCVGKTRGQPCCSARLEKHPHVRGEDTLKQIIVGTGIETPPRAWGRPDATAAAETAGGNTPTCVGKTIHPPAPAQSGQKHPHVRGEDTLFIFSASIRAETPPRAWGRPAFAFLV